MVTGGGTCELPLYAKQKLGFTPLCWTAHPEYPPCNKNHTQSPTPLYENLDTRSVTQKKFRARSHAQIFSSLAYKSAHFYQKNNVIFDPLIDQSVTLGIKFFDTRSTPFGGLGIPWAPGMTPPSKTSDPPPMPTDPLNTYGARSDWPAQLSSQFLFFVKKRRVKKIDGKRFEKLSTKKNMARKINFTK